MFVVLCALGLTLASPIRTYFSQQSDANALAAQTRQLQSDVNKLTAQKNLQNDPAYVIEQARERLEYVMPGETAYRVQVPAAPGPDPSIAAKQKQKSNPWYTNLWKTIAVPK